MQSPPPVVLPALLRADEAAAEAGPLRKPSPEKSLADFGQFLLNTSIYTALCVLALCLGAEHVMLSYVPALVSPLHGLIVGCTLIDYNVHHLFNRNRNAVPWTRHAVAWHWAMCGLGGLLCLWALPHLSWQVLAGVAALGLLAFAYSTPLLPFKYKTRLKDFGLLKIHVLTAVWVTVGTVLPALYWHVPFSRYWLELIIRCLLIFPLCIAFDIRDADADFARGINTLPNTLGIQTAYHVINYNLIAYFAFAVVRCIYRYSHEQLGHQLIIYALSGMAAWGAITLSRHRKHPFIYLALIDGVMLLYGALQAIL
jgi:4-hydroxybenzoate polyprenyltransferase